MSESDLMRRIQVAVSKVGARFLRNNVGVLQDKNGQYVRYGLCTGSSDLIGWVPVIITPDMVGKKIAIFSAIEVKVATGKPTQEQQDFINAILKDGGMAGIARCDVDALRIIK